MKGQWYFVAITILLASISSYLAFLLFFLYSAFKKSFSFACILFMMFIFTNLFIHFFYDDEKRMVDAETVKVVGRLEQFPIVDGDKAIFDISDQTKKKIRAEYVFESEEEKKGFTKVRAGHVCEFEGELQIPKKHTIEHGFNYQKYLQSKGINYLYKVKKINNCQFKPTVFNQIQNMRLFTFEFLTKHFDEHARGFVLALTIGERSAISESVYEAYQQLGIIHLLAISGLHVGIFLSLTYFTCVRLGLTKEHTWLLLTCFLPFYCVFAGAAPSVVRACLMASIFMMAKYFKKDITPLDCVSISLSLIILFDPKQVHQIGFQLSYAVTTALVLSQSILKRCQNALQLTVAVTFIAQLSSLPLLLFYFYEFSLLSFLVNILFVPIYVYVLLPLTFLSIIWALFQLPLSYVFQNVVEYLFQITSLFVTYINQWKGHMITVGKLSVMELVFCYILFVNFMIKLEKFKSYKYVLILFGQRVLIAILFLKVFNFFEPGEVTFIDVGQGDAIFIQEERSGNAYLIDTGGVMTFEREKWKTRAHSFDLGEDVLIPFLKSKGVTSLEALFLTHGDYDHIGEAKTLIHKFNIKYLIVSELFLEGEREKEIIQTAKKKGVTVIAAKGGQVLPFSTPFTVLSPIDNKHGGNDGSLVLFAKIGGLTWLFTGDLEKEGEMKIVNAYPKLKVDVLKVGHHGSSTSTSDAFLTHIKPSISIISVGRHNRFGHPDQEVVNRLKKEKVTIYRTDEMGSISYQFKGEGGTFQFFPPYDIVNN